MLYLIEAQRQDPKTLAGVIAAMSPQIMHVAASPDALRIAEAFSKSGARARGAVGMRIDHTLSDVVMGLLDDRTLAQAGATVETGTSRYPGASTDAVARKWFEHTFKPQWDQTPTSSAVIVADSQMFHSLYKAAAEIATGGVMKLTTGPEYRGAIAAFDNDGVSMYFVKQLQ